MSGVKSYFARKGVLQDDIAEWTAYRAMMTGVKHKLLGTVPNRKHAITADELMLMQQSLRSDRSVSTEYATAL